MTDPHKHEAVEALMAETRKRQSDKSALDAEAANFEWGETPADVEATEAKAMEWQPIETAPEGVEVMTKIHDADGERNQAMLVRHGRVWCTPDMTIYVYYSPTHWASMTTPLDE